MVIHHIGGRVLTIEVSTHADVGDMNMHSTESQTGSGIHKLLTFFTELLAEFHIVP